ncbi:hypothetical protein ACQ4PT_051404 [Festuca glaucescens]
MASTRAGSFLRAWSGSRLCHTCCDGGCEYAVVSSAARPSLVTRSTVLQYSRTCVTRPPGPTVQACTQYSKPVASVPSARTVDPKASTVLTMNGMPGVAPAPPVRRRMSTRCWCARGPWNHQSTSGFSSRRTVSASPRSTALYSSSTTALLLTTALSLLLPWNSKPASPPVSPLL